MNSRARGQRLAPNSPRIVASSSPPPSAPPNGREVAPLTKAQELAEMMESALRSWLVDGVPVISSDVNVHGIATGLAYQSREFWKRSFDK